MINAMKDEENKSRNVIASESGGLGTGMRELGLF